jgi:hypothetical protein
VDQQALVGREFVLGRLIRRQNLVFQTSGKIILEAEGRITGIAKTPQVRWDLAGNVLLFASHQRSVSTVFNEFVQVGECTVRVGHSLRTATEHFLYPYRPLHLASLKTLYVVTSHTRYSRALECLLPQMQAAGIAPENTWVTIAGAERSEVRRTGGITFSCVPESAFEYMGLIDVVRKQPPCDLVFLLHDTCHVGPRFLELLGQQPWSFLVDYLSVMPGGYFNIGLYRTSWLLKIREFLEGLVGLSKDRAVEIERNETGKGFKSLAPATSSFLDGFGKMTGMQYPYDPSTPREGVYLRGADIHKFYGPTSGEFKP